MKRKSREIPVLAQLLFPETYQDAIDALLKHMPFLKIPEMKEILIEKATFVTYLAISSSCEIDWAIKVELGADVETCILLPDESLTGIEKDSDDESRVCANYSFVNRMVSDYARNFGQSIKRLPHYK